MASKRQRSVRRIISPIKHARKSHAPRSHAEKLAYVSKYKRVPDPTNQKSVAKQFRTLSKFPLHLQKKADKATREKLKERGFFTTDKGFIVDVPRDAKRKQIPHTKLSVSKDGTVIFRNHKRRDYIVGFTKKEKRAFAKDPEAFRKKKLVELQKQFPTLRGKKLQVRLQWGAYQATKDFHPGYFTKRYAAVPERDRKRVNDRLTGFHIVVHAQPKKKGRKKK